MVSISNLYLNLDKGGIKMDGEKQLVIPLGGLIKLKDTSTRLFLKHKFVILTFTLVVLYQFLAITNNLHRINNLITNDFVSAFKIITTYILPWGILYCLVQITRKLK